MPDTDTTVLPVVTSSADGVLVGVDAPTSAPAPQHANPPAPDHRFTAEDVQKAREQEKGKLYSQIETLTNGQKAMDEELARLRTDREGREKAEADRVAAEEAQAKKAAEDDLDTRNLLLSKEKEWAEKFDQIERDREHDRILLEREREYSQLSEYRSRRVVEMADDIIPELQDLVTGNTPAEIDASLAGLAERSTKIIDSATNAAQAARRDMRGTQVTGTPITGPLETQSGQRQFTTAELADMPMSEYVKHRGSLLQMASQSKRGLLG